MVYGKIFFFIILTLIFFVIRQMLFLFVCYCQEVDVFLLFYEWQMLLPFYCGRCLYQYSVLQLLCLLMLLPSGRWNGHILFVVCCGADVIALWQVE